MKRIAVLLVFLALEGCGGVSLIKLPSLPAKPASAVQQPTAPIGKNCPADLTDDLDAKPAPPADAFIPKPLDPASKAGWDSFLNYMSDDFAGWANEGWRRAQIAKDWCAS